MRARAKEIVAADEPALSIAEALRLPEPEPIVAEPKEDAAKKAKSPGPALVVIRGIWLGCRMSWRCFVELVRYSWLHPYQSTFDVVLLLLFAIVIATGAQMHDQTILAEISKRSVDKIVEASRFTRDYQIDSVERQGQRAFLNVGAPAWSQREAIKAVLYYARKAGLPVEDQAVLLAIGEIESGFNPMARASTTSACGLFQFVKQTGELFGLKQGDCMDPWPNAQAGVAHYLYNYRHRVERTVSDLTNAERLFKTYELSYYLHHDGVSSSDPANDVKAIVLSGTQFLFRVHAILLEEAASKTEAPTFTAELMEKGFQFLHIARERYRYYANRLWGKTDGQGSNTVAAGQNMAGKG